MRHRNAMARQARQDRLVTGYLILAALNIVVIVVFAIVKGF